MDRHELAQQTQKAMTGDSLAFAEVRSAAESGDVVAQGDLGYLYHTGQGVERNMKEALFWIAKSAHKGNAKSQYNLGLFYQTGDGVAQNSTLAAEWWLKAAEQQNTDAQFGLGIAYSEGLGVKTDLAAAMRWWHKAYVNGEQDAMKEIIALRKRLLVEKGFKVGKVELSDELREITPSGFADDDETLLAVVTRHSLGDWGDINAEDEVQNVVALEQGLPVRSAYQLKHCRLEIYTDGARTLTYVREVN